jgi:hypothetical protein
MAVLSVATLSFGTYRQADRGSALRNKFMKALLLTALILAAAMGPTMAQKKSTLMGDIVIGELTGKDEATREITIKYPGKEGPEIFSGILADDYKLKSEDGRVWQLSEIVPGMHIRVFYKAGHEKVSGQEKKINKISRIDYLGKDEYARLRNQLNVDPSMAFAHAEKDDLPATSPLKVYLAIAYGNVHEYFVESIDKWNQKNGNSYGKLEVVSDLKQADISVVVAREADTLVVVLPAGPFNGTNDTKGAWSQATSYLVIKESEGLKVLWTRVVPVFNYSNTEASPKSFEVVMAELEKRMKARSDNAKK